MFSGRLKIHGTDVVYSSVGGSEIVTADSKEVEKEVIKVIQANKRVVRDVVERYV